MYLHSFRLIIGRVISHNVAVGATWINQVGDLARVLDVEYFVYTISDARARQSGRQCQRHDEVRVHCGGDRFKLLSSRSRIDLSRMPLLYKTFWVEVGV